MELYRKFIAEKDGAELLLTDGAFLAFKVFGKQLYIIDFYVDELKKHPGRLRMIMDLCYGAMLQHECDHVACHVPLNVRDFNKTLTERLKFGFKVIEANEKRLGLKISGSELEGWLKKWVR